MSGYSRASSCNAVFRLVTAPCAAVPRRVRGRSANLVQRWRLDRLAAEIDAADDVAIALFFQAISGTNTKATNVYVYFNRLLFADNFSNQTRHFHPIKAMTLFYLGNAVPLLPNNGCTVGLRVTHNVMIEVEGGQRRRVH